MPINYFKKCGNLWGNWGQAVYKLIKGINHTQKARDKSSEGKY